MIKRFCFLSATCVILLTLASCSSKKPAASPDELVGDWYTIKGDVESYSFMKDSSGGIYVGILHDRPVVNGVWKVENNKFIITPLNGQPTGTPISYSYKIINDTLFLNNGTEIYTKTPPFTVLHPEVGILEGLKSNLGFEFSEPRESEVNWIDGESKGYSISVNTTIGSDYYDKIVGYVKDAGFVADSLVISEICTGYKTPYAEGQIILTVCSSQDPDATDDKITIFVSSALKK